MNNREFGDSRWRSGMQGRGSRGDRPSFPPSHTSHGKQLFLKSNVLKTKLLEYFFSNHMVILLYFHVLLLLVIVYINIDIQTLVSMQLTLYRGFNGCYFIDSVLIPLSLTILDVLFVTID